MDKYEAFLKWQDRDRLSTGERCLIALCSLLIPGLGHVIAGYTLTGIVWFLLTVCTLGIAWPIQLLFAALIKERKQ